MGNGAYATAVNKSRANVLSSASQQKRRIKRAKIMKQKLTWRQRLRNWFNKDLEDELESVVGQDIEGARFSSEGMRFQLYRASGGYVVETRVYDHRNDRSDTKMYVITEEQDVGHEIGKIITMESLR
jgi:hypothetical protein